MANPIPYKGSEGYIFISYAHKDAELVLPIVEQMQRDGYRVWYDEGIDPGTEWDEFIASHVVGCGYFIAFMSRNYLLSENCKDELNFARDLKKPQVLVYLERVKLPRGIELRVGRCESFTADINGSFLRKLYKAEGMDAFRKAPAGKKQNKLLWVVPVVLAALLGIGAGLLPKNEPESTDPPPETTTAHASQDLLDMEGVVLAEENDVRITGRSMGFNGAGHLTLTLYLENTGDSEKFVNLFGCHLNGFPSLASCYWELSAGQSMEVMASWTPKQFEQAGVVNITSNEDIHYLQGSFSIHGYPATFFFSPQGEEAPAEYPMHENDQSLLDAGKYQVVLRNNTYTENGKWVLDLAFINTSNHPVDIMTTIQSINGYSLAFANCQTSVLPGSWVLDRVVVEDWTFLEEICIEQAVINVQITHGENYSGLADETITIYPEGNTDYVPSVRQLSENDILLLENEYIRLAILEPKSDGSNYFTFDIYGQNISSQPLSFRIEQETYNVSLGGTAQPGNQVYDTLARSFDDSTDRTIRFTLVVYDISRTELFRQTFEFDAGQYMD